MTPSFSSTAPVLASTLLSLDLSPARHHPSQFRTGTNVLDKDLPIFTSGHIIGIASESQRIHAQGNNTSTSLPAHLISTHLLSTNPSTSTATPISVSIISPPTSSTISTIHGLLPTELAHPHPPAKRFKGDSTTGGAKNPLLPRTSTEEHLNAVQVLQYLDIAGLAESLSEVSSTLHAATTYTSHTPTTHEPLNPKGPSSRTAPSTPPNGVSTQSKARILLIEGICPTLQSSQRRSGSVQTAALLSSLLRNLTYLARNVPGLMVLVELDYELYPPLGATRDARDVGVRMSVGISSVAEGGEIVSAFTDAQGRVMRIVPLGQLGGLLERDADQLVVRHDAFGKVRGGEGMVVEVVKDRVGKAVGRWCLSEEGT